jgi:hypothetical protein
VLTTALPGRWCSTPPPRIRPLDHDQTTVLVPQAHKSRVGLLRALAGTRAVVGPSRPWYAADASYRRAVNALTLREPAHSGPLDTDEHLPELVPTADPEAHADLARSRSVHRRR